MSNVEVANRTVDMDSRVRLLCYPRGSFYPLSSVPPIWHRRITKTCFRICSCRHTRSQAGFCLYTLRTMSIRTKPTFVPLRYLLARYRPSKTAHLALFLDSSPEPLGKSCHVSKGGVSLVPARRAGNSNFYNFQFTNNNKITNLKI